MKIKAKCWFDNQWVRFSLTTGSYRNIITFLDAQNLSFVTEIKLDFSKIPFELHGKGNSETLLQYLANNTDDDLLISQFLMYFLNITLNMRYYYENSPINFYFPENTSWQNFTISTTPPPTTSTTTVSPLSSVGESVMFIFTYEGIYKYIIHNFESDTNTETLSFDIDNNWHIDQSLSVTDKGFIEIFYDNNSIYRIFIIDLNGTISYQKDVSEYDYEFFNKYTTIVYEEDTKFYLIVYDGTIRTFEFDFYPEVSSNFSYYLDGGFVIETYDDYKFYLIKDGSTSAILIKEQAENTFVGCMTYEYSSLITFLIINNLDNNLLSAEIYNNDGIKIYDYDFTNVSTALNAIDNFSYLSESNSFTLVSYDSSVLGLAFIFYYSSESNTITYKQISSDYDSNFYYNNIRIFSNYNNYYSESQFLIFTKNYVASSTFVDFYESVFMLPIFIGDESIRDIYEFDTSGGTNGFCDYMMRRSEDNIYLFVQYSGNTNFDILKFNKNMIEPEISSTNIIVSTLYMNYLLYDRTIYITYDGDITREISFITLDGQIATGFTFTDGSFGTYYSRNTFFFSISNISKDYYSNTSTGNIFVELENFYDSYQTSYAYESIDNLSEGNIVIYNTVTELAQIITDISISQPFSINLIEGGVYNKYNLQVGKEYISIDHRINSGEISPNPIVIRIGYFNLNGELINSISSESYDLLADSIYGIRTYGWINDGGGFYTFNGTTINSVNVTTDYGFNDTYLNDYLWLEDY